MSSTRTQSQLSTATSISYVCLVSDFISAIAFSSRHVYIKYIHIMRIYNANIYIHNVYI